MYSGVHLHQKILICAHLVGPFGPRKEEKEVKGLFFLSPENYFLGVDYGHDAEKHVRHIAVREASTLYDTHERDGKLGSMIRAYHTRAEVCV